MGKKDKTAGLSDDRFSRVKSDPLFSGIKRTDRKVVIDKRFASALSDKKFATTAKVDMRGRKVRNHAAHEILDLYELEDNEKEKDNDDVEKFFDESGDDDMNDEEEVEDEMEEEDDDDDEDEEKSNKLDLARGQGNIESSSSDDSSDEEGEEEVNYQENDLNLDAAVLDQDAEQVEWRSKRLAVCNLDWDRMSCEDILMLVKSFLPVGGSVISVGIYISDYGSERLALEDEKGPLLNINKPDCESEDKEVDEKTKLAVRRYMVDRLKYYYSVVEFDSIPTAVAVYDECDGFQLEESGLKMDLRFVPDDMEFEENRIKEFLKSSDINLEKYKSKIKGRNGIAMTANKLRWDEDDETRSRKFRNAFDDEAAGNDLIVESGDDSEGEDEGRKALLDMLQTNDTGKTLEVEWSKEDNESDSDGEYVKCDDDDDEIGITRKRKADSEDEKSDNEEAAEEPKEKLSGYKAYKQKKKAKLAQKKLAAKKGQLTQGSSDIKNAEIVENVVKDDRFKALFTDSAFAIEPSSKKYKSTTLVSKQVEQKAKIDEENKTKKSETSSTDLVNKLKRKTEKLKSKK